MQRTEKNDWTRIRSIFDDALRQPAEDRLGYVRNACGEDTSLFAEVESLLESLDSAELFLETPAVVQVAEDSLRAGPRLTAGEMLLHYEIRELLGSGGMGEVYLARDTRLNRNVAVKVLRSSFLPDAQADRRLLREARAAALLEHPNICQTYEISETNEHSFIVMQYVVGTTLADILANRKLEADEALDLGIQIVDGLAEAHEQGIIHRDIKPANIIVNDKGQAKILDFGLAKFIEAETNAETAQRLNSSGAVMGTVPFMSPEQLRGKALDVGSDVFSFGALFYEMLAGLPAFSRDSNAETMSAILNDQPDWSIIPQELQPVLRRCLEKEVGQRYRSGTDVLGDLRGVQRNVKFVDRVEAPPTLPGRHTTGDQASPKKRAFYFWQNSGGSPQDISSAPTIDNAASLSEERSISVSRFVLATASLIVVVLGLSGAWVWLWQTNTRSPNDFDSLRPVRLVSWKSGAVTNATDFRISHDGRMIAYSSSQQGAAEAIYIKQTSDGQELQVTRDAWANVSPLWSPDSQRIAFVSIREDRPGIYVSPTLGGAVAPLKLTDRADISLRHWSRDGTSIYYDQAGNLYRLNVQTGESVKVTDLPDTTGVSTRYFAVSRDETRIVFSDVRDGQRDLWTIPAAGGVPTRITNDKEMERRPVWHPDGERLLYNVVRNDFYQINIIAADGRGEPVPVTRGEGTYFLMDVSPDGDRIFYASMEARSDISSVDIETGREEEVAAESETEFWPDISPDGKSIVYHTNASPIPSGRLSDSSLMIHTTGEAKRQLPNKGFDARWLPDSRHISLFRTSATRPNDFDAWLVDTVTGTERLMATESVMTPFFSPMPIARVDVSVFDFSPDSKRVAYLELKKPQNVKLRESESGSVRSLTKNKDPNVQFYSPKFARDGGLIGIVSQERFDDISVKPIWRVHVIDGDRVRDLYSTTGRVRFIGWSASGDLIVAVGTGNLALPIDVDLLAVSPSGSTRKLSTLALAYPRTLTMSRDGAMVAFSVNRDDRDDIWTVALAPGSTPRRVTANPTTRQFLANLAFSADGKRIYFDKQEEINTISMFENFDK